MKRLLLVSLLLLPSLASAGEKVLVEYGSGGLKAGELVLSKKAVNAAAYDPAQDLIWFRSGGNLNVVDLRSPKKEVVLIAKKWPEGPFAVKGLSNAAQDTDYAGLYPILSVDKKPGISTGMGAYGGIWEDQDATAKRSIKKIKIVGQKWMKKQAKRVAKTLETPAEKELPKVTLTGDLAQCAEDPDLCGRATPFGPTAYQLVVTVFGCGDACSTSCVLYDPKTKKVASPTETGTWGTAANAAGCDGYNFAPDGTTYASGTVKCTLTTKIDCTPADETTTYLGWIELP